MSENAQVLNNGQQAITNYDLSKIFVWDNRYDNFTLVNSEYDPMTILAGTVMGRIAGTGKLFPCTAEATDGSQYPIGILAVDVVVNDGASVILPVCVSGDVVKDKIIFFDASDTFDSVISGKTFYDRIGSDSVGIKIVNSTELTGYDNQ